MADTPPAPSPAAGPGDGPVPLPPTVAGVPPAPPDRWTDRVKAAGPVSVTVLSFVLLVWWLAVVNHHIKDVPTVINKQITIDTYQRSKDILLVVVPFWSAALGYWFGSQGTTQAQKGEAAAKKDADTAGKKAEAATADAQQTKALAAVAHDRVRVLKSAVAAAQDRARSDGPATSTRSDLVQAARADASPVLHDMVTAFIAADEAGDAGP